MLECENPYVWEGSFSTRAQCPALDSGLGARIGSVEAKWSRSSQIQAMGRGGEVPHRLQAQETQCIKLLADAYLRFLSSLSSPSCIEFKLSTLGHSSWDLAEKRSRCLRDGRWSRVQTAAMKDWLWVFLSTSLQTVPPPHAQTLLSENVFSGSRPPFPHSLSIDFFFSNWSSLGL